MTAWPNTNDFWSCDTCRSEQRLLDAVAAVVAASLDRADQRSVMRLGPESAARRYLSPDPCFVFDRAWWHLAYASDGSLIGFTQPVLFRDVLNGPMIRAFERAGYRRGRIRDVAFHD